MLESYLEDEEWKKIGLKTFAFEVVSTLASKVCDSEISRRTSFWGGLMILVEARNRKCGITESSGYVK